MAVYRAALLGLFTFLATMAAHAEFRLEDYFRGTTYADGRFSAINGVRRDFKVVLTGRWNGRTLTLIEDFTYADGEKDRKTWRFAKTGEGRYTGRREDVVGETIVRISRQYGALHVLGLSRWRKSQEPRPLLRPDDIAA